MEQRKKCCVQFFVSLKVFVYLTMEDNHTVGNEVTSYTNRTVAETPSLKLNSFQCDLFLAELSTW